MFKARVVAGLLLLFATMSVGYGDDPKSASPTAATWIEQLGTTDETKAREAAEGLLAILASKEGAPRTDARKDDFRAFRQALTTTEGLSQKRLLSVLAKAVENGSLSPFDSWWDGWDDFERRVIARTWARHGTSVLEPLLTVVRYGGHNIRDGLGSTAGLALAELGEPAVAPLLEILTTPAAPSPATDAADRDALIEAEIRRFGARSVAAQALARIPSAGEKAIGPMIAHLLEADPSDELMRSSGSASEEEFLTVSDFGLRFRAFVGMGEKAVPPLLVALAKQREPRSRVRVLSALRRLESVGAPAIPAIAALVSDEKEDHRVREAAVETLSYIRTEAVVEPLVRAMRVEAGRVGSEASSAFYLIGRPAVPALRRMLADKEIATRTQAAAVLAGFGAAAWEALPDLMKLWDDEGSDQWGTARYACGAISGSYGVAPEGLVARCLKALESEDPGVRGGALVALSGVAHGDPAGPLVARLADSDPDPTVQRSAVITLAEIAPSLVKTSHLPLLVAELGEQQAHRRSGAGHAAAHLPSALVPALLPLLVEAIPSWHDYACGQAIEVLANAGPAAQAAVPMLEELASDPDDSPFGRLMSRHYAKTALWRIWPDGAERAAKELESALAKSSPLDERALGALAKTGPRGAKAVPTLLRALTVGRRWDAADAAEALGGIGVMPEKVVPALRAALDSPEWPVRAGAATGLGGFAATAMGAVPRLTELLKDFCPAVRSAAAVALGRIAADAPRVVPALVLALRDEDERTRTEAAYSLGLFGAAAASALPALEASRDDREVPVQRTVARSLRFIRAAVAGGSALPMEHEPMLTRIRLGD